MNYLKEFCKGIASGRARNECGKGKSHESRRFLVVDRHFGPKGQNIFEYGYLGHLIENDINRRKSK